MLRKDVDVVIEPQDQWTSAEPQDQVPQDRARYLPQDQAPVVVPPTWSYGVPPRRGNRAATIAMCAAGSLLLVVAIVAVVSRVSTADVGVASSTGDPASQPVVVPAVPATLSGVTVSASGVRAPSKDSRGVATSYDPARAVDDDATTAWRADGQSGQTLVLRFPRPVELHRVGLIPGLAKTDPGDGTDRYAQNRRITAARLVVSDGSATNVAFDGSPGNRSMQWADIGTVVTDSLTITVVSSMPGSPQGGQPAYETVAISEVDVG